MYWSPFLRTICRPSCYLVVLVAHSCLHPFLNVDFKLLSSFKGVGCILLRYNNTYSCDRWFYFLTYYLVPVQLLYPLVCLSVQANYVALVREQTIPIERPLHVGKVSSDLCG
jgi:membrane-bound metal-dependent hydrolase YbcI (DUF457 family)